VVGIVTEMAPIFMVFSPFRVALAKAVALSRVWVAAVTGGLVHREVVVSPTTAT